MAAAPDLGSGGAIRGGSSPFARTYYYQKMNISKQLLNELNAVITIELEPSDYQGRVDGQIKHYQKTAKIPGFRPGHVPAGMIRKMYGKSLLVDELNNMLSESLGKYLSESKLPIIGSPLPRKRSEEPVFEEGNNFVFDYEVGLAPTFEVTMPSTKIPYYLAKVDEKMVEDDLNDLRRRYGKFSNPEASEADSILYGEFNEVNADGQLVEGGTKTSTTLSVEMVRDAEKRALFVGLKKGEVVTFNPMDSFGNEAEVAAMLKVDKTSPSLMSNYQFTVMTVNKVEKAELNAELFDKIYGPGEVTNEEEFREKIRAGITGYFEKESDRKLKKDVRHYILEEISIPLPDDFLKRMLKANSEKEIDENTFDHEYFHVAEDLRWNLIQDKIAQAQDISITEEEIMGVATQMVRQQFAQYGMPDPEADKLEDITRNYLNSENNSERIERVIKEDKVFNHLKKEVKLDMIEMPYADFTAKLNEKTSHEVEHHH